MMLRRIIIWALLILLPQHIHAQKLNLGRDQMSVEEVLKEVERKTDYYILLNQDLVDLSRMVRVDNPNAGIESVLEQVFRSTDTRFLIMDKQIIIAPEEFLKGIVSSQVDSVGIDLMEKGEVKGAVISELGEPLPGVNILIKGSLQGGITDKDGSFSLLLSGDSVILAFSYVGYESLELPADPDQVMHVVLREDVMGLEEVLKIGYGSMRRKDLTGAISSVKADALPLISSTSFGQALGGKIAGLQVTPLSAQPGGDYQFRVRGAGSMEAGNDPLIVIDGMPLRGMNQASDWWQDTHTGLTSPYNFLNPYDIESLEVLKDASATAIYGAMAANGVILITTKKGREGQPRIKYSGSVGMQVVSKGFSLMNASELMQSYNEASKELWMASLDVIPFGPRTEEEAQELNPWHPQFSEEEISKPLTDTDWLELLTRKGMSVNNNLNVSGGTQSTLYSCSINQHKTEGIVKNNGMDRYGVRLTLKQEIGKKVTFELNLSENIVDYRNMRLSDESDRDAGIFRAAYYASPLVEPQDEDGNYPVNPDASFLPNPLSMLSMTDDSRNEEFIGITQLEYRPLDGMRVQGRFGLNIGSANRGRYSPKATSEGRQLGGLAYISQLKKSDRLSEMIVTYSKYFAGRHQINLLGGYSYHQFSGSSLELYNTGYFSDVFTYHALSYAEDPTFVHTDAHKNALASYFGRVNYSFDNRLMFTATIRRDGSTRFAKNNKWGVFPSLGVGWNIHREAFFESARGVISFLKLRASIGETGNSNVGSYAFGSYLAKPAYRFGTGRLATGVFPARWANDELKWETTRELNFGLDLGFFKDRIYTTFEFYYKVVSDLLRQASPLQSYLEVPYIAANSGSTQSYGMEMTLNTVNLRKPYLLWTSDLTFSFYRDSWKERYQDWKPAIYESENDPLRPRWGYVHDGIMSIERFRAEGPPPHFPEMLPGMVYIKDLNGFATDESGNQLVDENGKFTYSGAPDGAINDADVVYLGNEDPRFLLGLSNQFSYRNFSMDVNFYGVFGQKMVNPWFSGPEDITRYLYNTNKLFMDRWKLENPSNQIPGYMQAIYGKYGDGEFMEQEAWFLRCRNITLGYRLPLKKGGTLRELRLLIDLQNLFIITPYDGIDPETDRYVLYPNVKTYSVGIDMSF